MKTPKTRRFLSLVAAANPHREMELVSYQVSHCMAMCPHQEWITQPPIATSPKQWIPPNWVPISIKSCKVWFQNKQTRSGSRMNRQLQPGGRSPSSTEPCLILGKSPSSILTFWKAPPRFPAPSVDHFHKPWTTLSKSPSYSGCQCFLFLLNNNATVWRRDLAKDHCR